MIKLCDLWPVLSKAEKTEARHPQLKTENAGQEQCRKNMTCHKNMTLKIILHIAVSRYHNFIPYFLN